MIIAFSAMSLYLWFALSVGHRCSFVLCIVYSGLHFCGCVVCTYAWNSRKALDKCVLTMPAVRKYRRDTSEVSCCLKYVIFGFNVMFWVSTIYVHLCLFYFSLMLAKCNSFRICWIWFYQIIGRIIEICSFYQRE